MKQSALKSSAILVQVMLAVCTTQNQSNPMGPVLHLKPVKIRRDIQPNAYCAVDDPVPIRPPLNCTLCEGQCGLIKDFRRDFYCSCDSACVVYGDCCVDFEETCPVQYAESRPLQTHFQHRRVDCYTVTTVTSHAIARAGPFGFIVPNFFRYNFVSVCGQSGVVCNRASLRDILDSNRAIPITDQRTGIHYVNYECARCNNVIEATPWIPHVSCDPQRVPFTRENVTFISQSVENLKLYLPDCEVNYIIPENVMAREFCQQIGHESECPSSCNNTELVQKCDDGITVDFFVGNRRKTYKNYYCALCSGEPSAAFECARVQFRGILPRGGAEVFSLSLLVDFDPSEGVTVGRKACSAGEKWVASTKECHLVSCPEDRRLVNGSCLSGSLQLQLTASLVFNRTKDLDEIFEKLNDITFYGMQMQLQQLLPGDNLELILNKTILSKKILNITLGLHLLFSKNSTFNYGHDLENFTETSRRIFADELILFI